jgi:hypothetical protein
LAGYAFGSNPPGLPQNQPRPAALMAAMSIFFMDTIASNALCFIAARGHRPGPAISAPELTWGLPIGSEPALRDLGIRGAAIEPARH